MEWYPDDKSLALGDRPNNITVVAATFVALSWVSVSLRVYVRAFMIHAFGPDDWIMLLTLGLYTGLCGCYIATALIEGSEETREAVKLGIMAELPIMARLLRIIAPLMGLYLWVTIALKLSLAIFFLRVITQEWHRKVVYVTTILYTLYGLAFSFIAIFQCGNPNDFLVSEMEGKCIKISALKPMNYASSSLNALTDWIYVFFPLAVVWKARMPLSSKLSVGFLLSMGAMGSISSLIRIAYIPGLAPGPHFFSNAIDIAVWSIIEPGLGICVASLATLRPLIRSIVETTRKSFGSSERSESTVRGSRSYRIPAAQAWAMNLIETGRHRIHDPESGVVFDMHKNTPRKKPSQRKEVHQDKVTLVSEENEALPFKPTAPAPTHSSPKGSLTRGSQH
ncbi:hypothetical protein AAFC00_003960 [Neodothiora populina]|uniref:Rhodopsin domain-containing protein n=1 Tax=Neodothiora populina TaxID=2781224 RepID=A0ABR3PJ64_9PEZI